MKEPHIQNETIEPTTGEDMEKKRLEGIEFANQVLETARINDIKRKTPPPIPQEAKRGRVARGTPPEGQKS